MQAPPYRSVLHTGNHRASRLPPGARPARACCRRTPLPPSLAEPAAWYTSGATSLEEYRLFALAQPAGVSAAFLADRAPAGMGSGGSGQESGPGGELSEEVSYLPQPVPPDVYEAQLVLTVVAAGSHGTLPRADAQVTWYPPSRRPAVVVWSTATGCGGSRITVDGHRQPSLADNGTVAALTDQVVSVHWEL